MTALFLVAQVHPVEVGCYLPYVEHVVLPDVNLIGVQDEVAVPAIEVAMPLGLYRDQLQVLNPPYL